VGLELALTQPARRSLGTVLAQGIKLDVFASKPCTAVVVVRLDKATARRTGLSRRARGPVTVATVRQALLAGKSQVTARFGGRARKALAKARSITFSVTVTATDAAGAKAHASVSVRARRP
jgi:hypothetical protein